MEADDAAPHPSDPAKVRSTVQITEFPGRKAKGGGGSGGRSLFRDQCGNAGFEAQKGQDFTW